MSVECQEKTRKTQKKQYDKKSKTSEYRVGQKVYLYVPTIRRKRVKKLSKLWRGPYRIVEVKSKLNVVLRVKGRNVVVHVNRIKPALFYEQAGNEVLEGNNPMKNKKKSKQKTIGKTKRR
ncbi:hypothetical protein LSTR_LSTR004207 [Laodelphax striatellus]|uniref:Uncharacterized protein n=1 Tax=Laodelphax striatellus TaxID=195883 RepID=A0A482X9P9_LAOST|nr:hypothetical protein LSTR_LSTR004207 [Laodelphax striatellus]